MFCPICVTFQVPDSPVTLLVDGSWLSRGLLPRLTHLNLIWFYATQISRPSVAMEHAYYTAVLREAYYKMWQFTYFCIIKQTASCKTY